MLGLYNLGEPDGMANTDVRLPAADGGRTNCVKRHSATHGGTFPAHVEPRAVGHEVKLFPKRQHVGDRLLPPFPLVFGKGRY